MLKADVCVGSFSGVVPMAPSPLAISALLGLAGGPLSRSPSVAFFHWRIWKTTFVCCNSHKLLIGRDEFMIESFGSIIRWSRGQSSSARARLLVRWTVFSCIKTHLFRRAKPVYACLTLCLFLMMCLCQFSRCPCRGMQHKFL